MATRKPIKPIHEKGVYTKLTRTTKWEKFEDVLCTYAIAILLLPIASVYRAYKWVTDED